MRGNKLASGSWPYGMFTHSRHFGHGYYDFRYPKAIIWQTWCFYLTILGAVVSAWGRSGGPWEQQERHVGLRAQIVSDFGAILGPHFESFFGPYRLNSVFFGACSQDTFSTVFEKNVDSWSS